MDLESFGWLLSRSPMPSTELVVAPPQAAEDSVLVPRVMSAYAAASAAFAPSRSFWDGSIRRLNADIDAALCGSDAAAAARLLRDPARNTHFWGFDAVCTAPEGKLEPHESVLTNLAPSRDWRELYAIWLHDSLANFADAIGARRLTYPESPKRDLYDSPDAILDRIDETLSRSIQFPNPYADELGLKTRRGVVGFRAIQSLYQGWRIAQFARGNDAFKVLEIGAGLGRTAYFAHQFGVRNYSIIDVPLTNAAQGYFLGRTLGPDNVKLYGEPGAAAVTIHSASELATLEGRYDLIANVDSLTEMTQETARSYWSFAKRAAPTILSINHEFNPFTFRELYAGDASVFVERYPYWMRRGYVEEIVHVLR